MTKIAADVIAGLKAQPIALAVTVIMALMLWLFYSVRQQELKQQHEIRTVFQAQFGALQKQLAELQARCGT